jgi:tetratricopeptide (TPR) repeat protein
MAWRVYTSRKMPSRTSLCARVAAQTLIALSLVSLGCGGPGTGTKRPILASGEAAVRPVDVKDDDFSASLVRVLQDGSRTPERLGLLMGVVRRQLGHAQQRFVMGQSEHATASVLGALYLLRAGEGQVSMIDDQGAKALDGAIRFLGTRGDEGRTHALMRMRAATLGDNAPEKAQLDQHMTNLERWLSDTHAGSEGERRGAEARYLMARSMVDASEDTLDAAADAITAWVRRGLDIDQAFRTLGKRPTRAEGMEAARSLETGPMMLAALYARHGDAGKALSRLEGTDLRRITEPQLRRALIAASEDGDVRGWEMLAATFAQEGAPDDDDDSGSEHLSADFVEAAMWGTLLEAYRKDPSNMRVSMFLSERLVRLGMSEGAAGVLSGGLGATPDSRFVGEACSILLEGMSLDAEVGDDAAVRRTFRAAAPILAAADRPEVARNGVDAIATRVRHFMATIEARAGNLAAARPLFLAVARSNPSVAAWVRLGRVDRQLGDSTAALESIRQAVGTQDARLSLADVCEANLMTFEIHRDAGQQSEAKTALQDALAVAIAMQKQRGDVGNRARAETLLGRVYDAYGEAKAAKQAHERALSVSVADRDVLGATVLQTAARALVRRDLDAGRAALKQGLEADINLEDRIYAGLWLQLLQRQTRAPVDETITRALTVTGERDSWVVKLAMWAMGKMTDDALNAAAQNTSQKVEAEFYTAMARRVGGDPAGDALLRRVANSPVIDLIEVQLAKDLLAPSFRIELPPSANAVSP